MNSLLTTLQNIGGDIFGANWQIVWTLIKIILLVVPIMLSVAYLTWLERKVIGYMQVRIGPNRVGPWGLIQPIADGLKLFMKEILLPTQASKAIFLLAPMLTIAPALACWAVIPFNEWLVLANIDASLLYIMAISSIGVYGIILAGWASNSKYALFGAMRSSAQMISYEIAMGLALICVLMLSGSLNLVEIVKIQKQGWFASQGLGFLSWNFLPLLPMFLVYLIAGVAETNRAPFDVAEGESEIVAGFHVEYSGMAFAIFFLAEYANMILVATLTSLLFLGGWLSPVGFLPDSIFWLFVKMLFVLILFLWFRATFPRYRYDQLMRLGWKVFIPLCILWIAVIAIWLASPLNFWLGVK